MTDERAVGVEIDNEMLHISLMDGRVISAPLSFYPRLMKATAAQRANCKLTGGGYGIHWPDIDEDLSAAGLLRGQRAQSCPAKLIRGESRRARVDCRGCGKLRKL